MLCSMTIERRRLVFRKTSLTRNRIELVYQTTVGLRGESWARQRLIGSEGMRVRPCGSVEACPVGKPGHRGEHAEPAEGAHDSADFLVLGEEAPLREKNRPVTFLRANQGQSRGACVGHVGADVGKVFEKPEDGKGKADGFALPKETGGAQKRHEQFAEGSTKNHDGVAEPTEEEMPALVDHQIDEIEE